MQMRRSTVRAAAAVVGFLTLAGLQAGPAVADPCPNGGGALETTCHLVFGPIGGVLDDPECSPAAHPPYSDAVDNRVAAEGHMICYGDDSSYVVHYELCLQKESLLGGFVNVDCSGLQELRPDADGVMDAAPRFWKNCEDVGGVGSFRTAAYFDWPGNTWSMARSPGVACRPAR